jgi:hypothetical protein
MTDHIDDEEISHMYFVNEVLLHTERDEQIKTGQSKAKDLTFARKWLFIS